jgi:hypothetical protein
MAPRLLHTRFVFRTNHARTDPARHVNGTIWSQWSHVNATILLNERHAAFQLSNKLIWKEICWILPELWHQNRPDRSSGICLESRIEPFELYKHAQEIMPAICL